MRTNKTYYVQYRLYQAGEVLGMCVPAPSKAEAYDKAVYELIPAKHQTMPYSCWVSSVTYNNGNCVYFNTHEGRPY